MVRQHTMDKNVISWHITLEIRRLRGFRNFTHDWTQYRIPSVEPPLPRAFSHISVDSRWPVAYQPTILFSAFDDLRASRSCKFWVTAYGDHIQPLLNPGCSQTKRGQLTISSGQKLSPCSFRLPPADSSPVMQPMNAQHSSVGRRF